LQPDLTSAPCIGSQTIEQPPASGHDASTVAAAGATRDEAGRYFETWSAGLTALLAAGGQQAGTTGNP